MRRHSNNKKKLRPCAARHLVSTVLKPGSTIPITDILRPIAIATALEKHTINCFRKARSDLVEWFTYYFDSRLIIFAIFFEFQKSEHLAETPIVTGVTACLATCQSVQLIRLYAGSTATVHLANSIQSTQARALLVRRDREWTAA